MKGDRVTLDGLDDGTIWPDGEFVVLTEPRLVYPADFREDDKNKARSKKRPLFGGLGYINVRRVTDSTGHLVVPVAHTRPVKKGGEA